MNILFVCSANKQRSKTAEDYFSKIYTKHSFLSAGTNHKICNKENGTPLTEDLLIWADKIFVMEQKHATIIKSYTNNYNSKIMVLDILDIYKYNDAELLKILINKINL